MDESGKKFVRIEGEQRVLERLNGLVSSGEDVLFWGQGIRFESKILDVADGRLHIKGLPFGMLDSEVLTTDSYYFTFKSGSFQYFGKGNFEFQADKELFLKLKGDEFYRVEKRRSDRMIVFPHMNVMVDMGIFSEDEGPENVLSFSRPTAEEVQTFEDVKGQLRGKRGESPRPRVFDVSSTGISILVARRIGDRLADDQVLPHLVMTYNDRVLKMESARVVYKVPFIDRASRANDKIKLGIEFEKSDYDPCAWMEEHDRGKITDDEIEQFEVFDKGLE